MSRFFTVGGIFVGCAAMLGGVIAMTSMAHLAGANAAVPSNGLAGHRDALDPIFIDFTDAGWEDTLYLSEYSVGSNHHYRTNFEPSAIAQHDNGLRLTISEAAPGNNWEWDSAEVQVNKETGYGRYEVIMKPAVGSGLISSFFTYTGDYYGDPHDEIDIEFIGKNRNEVEFNTFKNGEKSGGVRHVLGYNASEEFHLYAFDWQPHSIKFYVDNELVHEVSAEVDELPTYAGRLMINLWTGTMKQWHGNPEFEPGVAAVYRCIAYRPMGDRKAPLCSEQLD